MTDAKTTTTTAQNRLHRQIDFEPFSKPCTKCGQTIGYNGREVCKELRFDGKPYHEWCLCCDLCSVSIAGKLVKKKDDKIICEDCFREHYLPKCSGCQRAFEQGDERILYNNQIYHQKCFVCSECKTPVDKNRFFKSEGSLKCYDCFSKRRSSLTAGSICPVCQQLIKEGAVAFRGKNYHRSCFVCKGGCGAELGGTEFAIKNGECYCFDCYIDKYGKPCERCLDVVVGLGDLRKITYENSCWHPECFTCFECLVELEKQKFKQLYGEIYCLTCAKMVEKFVRETKMSESHSMQSRNNSIQFDDDHELGEIDFGDEGDGDAMDGEFDDFDISAELEASMRLYGEAE